MIILDIETTGTVVGTHQIVSLGAVCYKTKETFYGECSIAPDDKISSKALEINGFTEKQVRDQSKQTPLSLYQSFAKWAEGRSNLLAGQNVGHFDILFLEKIHRDNLETKFPFKYNTVDLHSVVFGLIRKSLSLEEICTEFNIEPETKPHNALNGALKEYECFKRLWI